MPQNIDFKSELLMHLPNWICEQSGPDMDSSGMSAVKFFCDGTHLCSDSMFNPLYTE